MKKETKIFILVVIIIVAILTAIDIQTKGKITSLMAYVNPTNIQSSDVWYGSNGKNYVQGALDNLYSKATAPNAKNNVMYYAYTGPTTSSSTDYTTVGKNVFFAINGGQKSVCIIRNSRLHCFDNNNWVIEKDHIQQVFRIEIAQVIQQRLVVKMIYFIVMLQQMVVLLQLISQTNRSIMKLINCIVGNQYHPMVRG